VTPSSLGLSLLLISVAQTSHRSKERVEAFMQVVYVSEYP